MTRTDDIRARLAAATPGPWRASLRDGVTYDDGSNSYRGGIYPGTESGPPPILVTNSVDRADADLIACAPDDLAWLLATPRPLPSREEIARAILTASVSDHAAATAPEIHALCEEAADAVLDLIDQGGDQ